MQSELCWQKYRVCEIYEDMFDQVRSIGGSIFDTDRRCEQEVFKTAERSTLCLPACHITSGRPFQFIFAHSSKLENWPRVLPV